MILSMRTPGSSSPSIPGQALLDAVRAAAAALPTRMPGRRWMRRGMEQDFSWRASAGAYSALVPAAVEGRFESFCPAAILILRERKWQVRTR